MAEKKEEKSKIDRRKFCVYTGAAALGVASVAQVGAVGFFMSPRVLYEPSLVYPIGRPGDFPIGQATFREKERLYVFNDGEGIYSISSVCTHLGCNVNHVRGEGFLCPCHGSVFNKIGEVLSGPAPKPLAWYRVHLTRKGVLQVNKADEVDAGFRLRLG